MWFGVVSLLPEIVAAQAEHGVFGRAIKQGLTTIEYFNPRDFTSDKHRTVDDKPYGGGAGMVLMAEPLSAAVEAARHAAPDGSKVIYLAPSGSVFNQAQARQQSAGTGLILVCGRYEGVDQRFISEYVDEIWSLGDFVLSGGEIPALAVMDAIIRHIPGVLGNIQSNLDESHLDGTIEYPQYTRPEKALNIQVPEVLLGGNHKAVQSFNRQAALAATYEARPDLLRGRIFNEQDRALLADYFLKTKK